tara:strand:- start:287 stop:451 length:165 start_codon:yes stop_codon:yes gene_type:complete
MENFDLGEAMVVIGGVGAAIITAGVFFSRFTKTDKDDKFFARLAETFLNRTNRN